MIVGPSGLSLIHPSNIKFIDSLAQAGVSLLLFESGISFDRPSIQRSYRTAATTFFLQAFTTILLVEVVLSRVISFGESGIRSTLLFTLCMSLSSSSTMGELRGELYAGIDQNAFRTAATILAGQDLIMGLFLCLPVRICFIIRCYCLPTWGRSLSSIGSLPLRRPRRVPRHEATDLRRMSLLRVGLVRSQRVSPDQSTPAG